MDKMPAFMSEAKAKVMPIVQESQKAMTPFAMAASYCLLCIAWVIALPFSLAADFLAAAANKFKPKA